MSNNNGNGLKLIDMTLEEAEEQEKLERQEHYINAVMEGEKQALILAANRNTQTFKTYAKMAGYFASGATTKNRNDIDNFFDPVLQQIGLFSEDERQKTLRTKESGWNTGLKEPRYIPDKDTSKSDNQKWLSPKQLIKYTSDEESMAELFVNLFKDKCVFDYAENQWFIWNDNYWEPDTKEKMHKWLVGPVAAQFTHAAAELQKIDGEDKRIDILNQAARQLRNRKKCENVLYMARKHLPMESQWDNNLMMLATESGVINLENGQLEPGNQEDYLRTAIPTEYKGLNEPCPEWERFLSEILPNNTETIEFLQRWFGYCLTGKINEHAFLLLAGTIGRNGKSTMLETVKHILGSIAGPVDEDILIYRKKSNVGQASPHIMRLQGMRLCWVKEVKAEDKINSELIKHLTGGEHMSARQLHQKEVEWKPTHKIILSTNARPESDSSDESLWERVKLIELTQRFIDNPQFEYEHKRDINLEEKLREESSGILAWLVKGCLEWQRIGLATPEYVRLSTKEYQEEQDWLSDFLSERCYFSIEANIKASDLYEIYKGWASDRNERVLSLMAFGQKITTVQKIYKEKKTEGIFYMGIGSKNTMFTQSMNTMNTMNTNSESF